eukprot:986669-Prorocentrum_minimum.AAC.1
MGGKNSDLTCARLTRANRSSIQLCDSFEANQRGLRPTLRGYAIEISRASRKNLDELGFRVLLRNWYWVRAGVDTAEGSDGDENDTFHRQSDAESQPPSRSLYSSAAGGLGGGGNNIEYIKYKRALNKRLNTFNIGGLLTKY